MIIGTEVLCLSSRVCWFLLTFLGWMWCDVYVFSGGYLGFWGDMGTWEERERARNRSFGLSIFWFGNYWGFVDFHGVWGLLFFFDCGYCVKGDGVGFSVHLKVKFSLANYRLKMRLVFFLLCGGFLRLLCCTFYFWRSFVFLWLWALRERWCWIFSAFQIQVCNWRKDRVKLRLVSVCWLVCMSCWFCRLSVWTVIFSEIFSEIRRWRRWRCGSKFSWTTWSLELLLGHLRTSLWASKLYPCLCMYVYCECELIVPNWLLISLFIYNFKQIIIRLSCYRFNILFAIICFGVSRERIFA